LAAMPGVANDPLNAAFEAACEDAVSQHTPADRAPRPVLGSPVTKTETQDAIRIFSALAETNDVETLRSCAEGLGKAARKGWQCAIDAENGVAICLSLLKQPSPRVYTKALALLNPLASHENCRPGLVAGGAVEFAWSYARDPASENKAGYDAECWKESLQAICHFACAPEQVSHSAVVDCGGVQALVDNIGTSLTGRVVVALQNLSSKTAFHQAFLSTDALSKLQTLLNVSDTDEIRTAAAATCANLAENTECHHAFELQGITKTLLNCETDNCPKLRSEVARGLANLCRVMTNQRAILLHQYLWSTYAVLGLSTDPMDQEVATNFYLYVSENEALAEILQYTGVPVSDHVLLPLVALGYSQECSERVSIALGNLASTVRLAMCNEDDVLQLIVTWLEDSNQIAAQSEAVRVLTTLCSANDQSTANVLHAAVSFGALPGLSALAVQNANIVVKCDVSKLLALVCKFPELHSKALENGALDHFLELARTDDYVIKAEAVNSLSSLFNNHACHAQLVLSGGLICGLEMAQSEQALLNTRGLSMLSTLCRSHEAHLPMVHAGCLEFFQKLSQSCSEEIRAVIAEGFSLIASSEECCKAMCAPDHVKVLGAMAEERTHMLSSGSLRVLMSMAERFHKNGVSELATTVLADLSGIHECRDEMLENDGFARLSALAGCNNEAIRRETSRILAHFMDQAESNQ